MRASSLFVLSILVTVACGDTSLLRGGDGGNEGDGSLVFVDGQGPAGDGATDGPADGTIVPRDGLEGGASDGSAPPQPLSPVTSGTRLQAGQIVADGFSTWTGEWVDQQLGITCRFAALADGSVRCLPVPTGEMSVQYYADSSCSGPGLINPLRTTYDAWTACGMTSTDLRFWERGAFCLPQALHGIESQVNRLLGLGAEVQLTKVYSLFSDGSCREGTPEANRRYFRVTEVATSGFTSAQVEDGLPAPGARLAPVELIAEDGARERIAFFDTLRGERCTFSSDDGNLAHCMPAEDLARVSTNSFGDSSCSERTAYGSSLGCSQRYARESLRDADCSLETHLYELGAKQDQVYNLVDGQCRSVTSTATHFSVGSELPLALFFSGTLSSAATAGRIVPQHWDAGVEPPPVYRFVDSQLSCSCRFRVAADDKTRCLPSSPFFPTGYFTDDQCTAALVYSQCPLTSTYALKRETVASTCGYRYHVHQVGAALPSGATIYRSIDGVCEQASLPFSYVYPVGAELPASDFVEGVRP